jgi:hypothetical protein
VRHGAVILAVDSSGANPCIATWFKHLLRHRHELPLRSRHCLTHSVEGFKPIGAAVGQNGKGHTNAGLHERSDRVWLMVLKSEKHVFSAAVECGGNSCEKRQ